MELEKTHHGIPNAKKLSSINVEPVKILVKKH